MKKFGSDCTCTIQTPWGEFAWRINDIYYAISMVRSTNGVILGGDVITTEMEYTGSNWFYQPTWPRDIEYTANLRNNVEQSIQRAQEYIDRYISLNNQDCLFVFVVCSAAEAYLFSKGN